MINVYRYPRIGEIIGVLAIDNKEMDGSLIYLIPNTKDYIVL